jgi:hypothetical protein
VKRLLSLFVIMAFLFPSAFAQAAEGDFPKLNWAGFLDAGEFVYQNKDEGVWRYASLTLKVEIFRKYDKEQNLTWYEAEIWSRDGDVFRCIPNDPEDRIQSEDWPKDIAKKNGTVFAINSDFAHLRLQQKKRSGILIRDGVILSEKTLAHNKGTFPNLDNMALYPDGRMEVYASDAYKAQEYIDMGALDVLAFGPYLIKDGALNDEALAKYGKSLAPRTAIGMVEPGHYFAMMLEGRHSKSKGAGISFLGEKLLEKGCQTGFNLDGGQTATMVFMGEQIIHVGKTSGANASARRAAEILGIGTSEQVKETKK